jgi:ubiquinone/menaquinone biosynthesis C-methylase UbiE
MKASSVLGGAGRDKLANAPSSPESCTSIKCGISSDYCRHLTGTRRLEISKGVHNFVLYSHQQVLYSLPVACATNQLAKDAVAEFWNSHPCGERYLNANAEFESHAETRYRLEPHIPAFARFAGARGLKVLEVGVGTGADYEQWLKAGAQATGVDFSEASLNLARKRCELAGLKPDLRLGDAENLPFASNTFDVLYSYGVMHHSPNPDKCLQEALRVIKPGGEARIMLYHHPSLTGVMLWLRYGLWRRESIRQSAYKYLESPGTHTFTRDEVRILMRDFGNLRIDQVYSPGDLLLHKPSFRFRGAIYRLAWGVFPRVLIRRLAPKWGLFLLITVTKPGSVLE